MIPATDEEILAAVQCADETIAKMRTWEPPKDAEVVMVGFPDSVREPPPPDWLPWLDEQIGKMHVESFMAWIMTLTDRYENKARVSILNRWLEKHAPAFPPAMDRLHTAKAPDAADGHRSELVYRVRERLEQFVPKTTL